MSEHKAIFDAIGSILKDERGATDAQVAGVKKDLELSIGALESNQKEYFRDAIQKAVEDLRARQDELNSGIVDKLTEDLVPLDDAVAAAAKRLDDLQNLVVDDNIALKQSIDEMEATLPELFKTHSKGAMQVLNEEVVKAVTDQFAVQKATVDAQVKSLIADVELALEDVENGKDGRDGRDGEDGKDAEQVDVLDVALALASNDEYVKALQGFTGGKGEQGEKGLDGKDADPSEVAKSLFSNNEFLEKVTGPAGERGKKGDPGTDKITIAPRYVKSGDKLEKNEVAVHDGGLWQAVRKANGTPKEDPGSYRSIVSGISSVDIDYNKSSRSYEFNCRLSDGEVLAFTSADAPRLRHPDDGLKSIVGDHCVVDSYLEEYNGTGWEKKLDLRGDKGEDGTRGRKGLPGRDGVGIDDVFVDGQTVTLLFTNGETKELLIDIAIPEQENIDQEIKRYAGKYKFDTSYSAGDVVTAPDGLYVALKNTKAKLSDSRVWALMQGSQDGFGAGAGGGAAGGWPPLVTSDLDMNTFRITNLGMAINPNDAISKRYFDANQGAADVTIRDTTQLLARNGTTTQAKLRTLFTAAAPPRIGSLVLVGYDQSPATNNTSAGFWRYDGFTFRHIQTAAQYPALTGMAINQLGSPVWDPQQNQMVWRDDRDALLTVPDKAGLFAIPTSHLKPGKLVFERDTNQLWEFIAAPAAMTRTIADWKPAGGGGGVKVVNRVADLQLPAADPMLKDGSLAVVRFHADAVTPFNELFILRSTPPATTGGATTWQWLPVAPQIDTKPTRAGADTPDPQPDDIQVTTENGHKEIKLWDSVAGAWVTIYSEDQVQSWIAAGNLFVGTAEETGHGIAGAIDLGTMPAETALGATDKGHYWTWVGNGGYSIKVAEIGGLASGIDGALLNVGDWIQVAEATPGVYTYTVIPGDLLAKARGDSLYGLNIWAAGAYEQGALVVHQGKIYKATRPILGTDPSPDTAASGWQDIQLNAGVRNVPADGNLPATAPAGDVYLVVNSAQAGGKPTFYTYDTPSAQWLAVGGGSSGSLALDISTGGDLIFNIGCPVGSVMMWTLQTPPEGWLFCDGKNFNATRYPTLNSILGNNSTPNLTNQFVRAADPAQPLDFAHKPYTTGKPKTLFTGHTSTDGNHSHSIEPFNRHGLSDGGGNGNLQENGRGGHVHTLTAGNHSHTVLIDTGGDAETAPDHILLYYIIKAEDDGMNTRTP